MENKNIVFVVGVFRSGTSLLCSLLNQNPKVALMYECDVWNFPRSLLAYRFKRNWAERVEFFNQSLSRHRLVPADNGDALAGIRTPAALYDSFRKKKDATIGGEKSPFYCDRLEQIHAEYPGAAFIFVWRDPAEVYRSVLKAGQTSRFFGKPGMLSRMIYLQEQAIRQGRRIEKKGARIFRLSYATLVDNTEQTCRDLSAFMGIPFDPQMLVLNKADLSSVYKAPHHAYLRRGVIERQQYTEELVSRSTARKLKRFRHHWEKQQSDWLQPKLNGVASLPGRIEFLYHNTWGKALTAYDSTVRAGFEFLPLSWLKVYRLLKIWLINPPSGALDEKTSMLKEVRQQWETLVPAGILMAAVVLVHWYSNPHLMFLLFYATPCALVALIVNTRWATVFVLIASVVPPLIQYDGDEAYRSPGVMIWNFISRLILLEIIVLLLGRIRLEFSKPKPRE